MNFPLLDDRKVVVLFHAFDPFAGLSLRIDHQRPTPRVRNDHSIVHGERVLWEAADLPLPEI